MKRAHIKVAPSILSCDFGHLADEVKKVEAAGCDYIHVDIMDGHFVPNLTMGPAILAAIRRSTKLFLDVHLMIYNPHDYVEAFVKAGGDRLTFHFEATENVEETLSYIKKCNVKAGLAFCPETPSEFITRYLEQVDLILLMTVHPGFGGQKFMPEVLEKIRFTRMACDKLNLPNLNIEVDGGINGETAAQCVEAGANVLVAGTYLFKEAKSMQEGIETLKALGEK